MMSTLKLLCVLLFFALCCVACSGNRVCDTVDDCLSGEICGIIEDVSMNLYFCQPASACADLPNIQACTAKTNTCLKENQVKGCVRDKTIGCMSDGVEVCDKGAACLPKDGTASCAVVCKSSKECTGSLGCRPLPGFSNAHCSDNADYLTVETQCTVTIKEASIPPGTWDNVISGSKSKADPYVVITLASGKKLTTKTFQNSTDPVWDYTTDKMPLSEIARMRIILYDSDDGQVVANKDDVVGNWSNKNDRWLLKNAKKKDIGLVSGSVRLYVSIQCE